MFEYRQVLTRMRLGDTDRAIARVGLMGRRKVAQLRRTAEAAGWLDVATPLPGDPELAVRAPGFGAHTARGRLAGRTASRADHALVASRSPGHHHPRRPGTQPRLHRLVLLGAPFDLPPWSAVRPHPLSMDPEHARLRPLVCFPPNRAVLWICGRVLRTGTRPSGRGGSVANRMNGRGARGSNVVALGFRVGQTVL